MKYTVFVYGTLKTGHRNHHLMDRLQAVFLGEAETRLPMTISVRGRLPFLWKDPDAIGPVVGELYEIDEFWIGFLDQFEGHPEWYRREEIGVVLVKDGERFDKRAWAYMREEAGEKTQCF